MQIRVSLNIAVRLESVLVADGVPAAQSEGKFLINLTSRPKHIKFLALLAPRFRGIAIRTVRWPGKSAVSFADFCPLRHPFGMVVNLN